MYAAPYTAAPARRRCPPSQRWLRGPRAQRGVGWATKLKSVWKKIARHNARTRMRCVERTSSLVDCCCRPRARPPLRASEWVGPAVGLRRECAEARRALAQARGEPPPPPRGVARGAREVRLSSETSARGTREVDARALLADCKLGLCRRTAMAWGTQQQLSGLKRHGSGSGVAYAALAITFCILWAGPAVARPAGGPRGAQPPRRPSPRRRRRTPRPMTGTRSRRWPTPP